MNAVLVDTSVWRRYFAGGTGVRSLGELLDVNQEVVVHPWVVGELVLGGLSSAEARLLEMLPPSPVVPHDEVLGFIRHRKLARRGIGWVDVNLLASALVSGSALWSLDRNLAAAAEELGISYTGR